MSDEEFTEEVVLSRWGKIKQWWEMGSAVVKVVQWAVMGFKLLFIGSTAAVIVGQVTDTNPMRDVGVEIGIVETRPPMPESADAALDELLNLQEEVTQLQEDIQRVHSHQYAATNHEHPAVDLTQYSTSAQDAIKIHIRDDH